MNRRKLITHGTTFGVLAAAFHQSAGAQTDACPSATPPAELVSFSSDTGRVTPSFHLEPGTTVFRFNKTGGDFLYVTMIGAPGSENVHLDLVQLFFPTFESGDFSTAKTIEEDQAGTYIIVVDGPGDHPWTITIEQ